jgi:hypothetical protein
VEAVGMPTKVATAYLAVKGSKSVKIDPIGNDPDLILVAIVWQRILQMFRFDYNAVCLPRCPM